MSEAELMHAIYENRKVAFAFYQFAPDAVGPERDAARKALLESDAALRKQLAAPAAPEWKRCPHCRTHEIEIERTCHNASCTGYARAESVYRGWQQGAGK